MCGICGAMSQTLSRKELDGFTGLFITSAARGVNGAGVVSFHGKRKPKFTHTVGSSSGLIRYKDYDDVVYNPNASIVLGHTRSPTVGDPEDVNFVHPHQEGHIIGVHNGTLTKVNNNGIPAKQSDSVLIFRDIATRGIDAAIQDVIGAYTLVWVDTKEGTLNFLRNWQRPLFFAMEEEEKEAPTTIWWASEKEMFDFALVRTGFKVIVKELPVNTLISFPTKIQKYLKYKERKIEYTYTYKTESYYPSGGYSAFDHDWNGKDVEPLKWEGIKDQYDPPGMKDSDYPLLAHSSRSSLIDQLDEASRPKWFRDRKEAQRIRDNVVQFSAKRPNKVKTPAGHLYRIYLDRWLRETALIGLLQHGCGYCSNVGTLQEVEYGKLAWTQQNEYFCQNCQGYMTEDDKSRIVK